MERQQFLERVQFLRREEKSIRAIAAELGVHPSRVQRALKVSGRMLGEESAAASANRYSLLGPEGRPFVGRQREMVELKEALDGAVLGQGHIAMLHGEPGIGKTRTAKELASHAQRNGAQVLWGWCYEEEGAPPYWP